MPVPPSNVVNGELIEAAWGNDVVASVNWLAGRVSATESTNATQTGQLNTLYSPLAVNQAGVGVGPTDVTTPWNLIDHTMQRTGLVLITGGFSVAVTGAPDATIDIGIYIGSTPYRFWRQFALGNTTFQVTPSIVLGASVGEHIYVQIRKVSGGCFYECAAGLFNNCSFLEGIVGTA